MAITRRLFVRVIPANLRLTSAADTLREKNTSNGGIASVILVALSVLLWAASLSGIDLQQMDDTGLISVMPAPMLLSLLILNISFCIAIFQRPLPVVLLLAHILAAILMLYGVTAIVQEVPRFAIGWKLAGIMDYVIQTGTVDGRIDAFFNWPSFFILMAFVTRAVGAESAVQYMGWAPVFFNVLYLAPLWMIFRAATSDERLVMLGLWFFYLANWIGQDYLAPQALNVFFFLSVVAILLTWFRGRAWDSDAFFARSRSYITRYDTVRSALGNWLAGNEQSVAFSTPVQRASLIVVIVMLFTAMVASHQLTPFALLAATSFLVAFNRCTTRTLPVLFGTMIVTWVFYMATPYLHGHIEHISQPVGSVGNNIDANLTERFRGSPGHLFINTMRILMSLGIWGLAFLGVLRRMKGGYRDWGHLIVAVSPFPLLLLQAYGGELLLRIYLYSVAFMSFFVAALFFPKPTAGRSLASGVALGIVSFTVLISFLFTRYGNERMMYFTSEELDAVEYVYTIAEPGSQLVAATGTLPWRFQDYRTYQYSTVPREARRRDIESIEGIMASRKFPASFLILTRSQQASGELFIGWPPGAWDEFVVALRESDKFHSIYANNDAEIYVLTTSCRRDMTQPWCANLD